MGKPPTAEHREQALEAVQVAKNQRHAFKKAINEAKEQAIKSLQEISTDEGLSPLQASTKILSPLFPVLVFKLAWMALDADTPKAFQACMKDVKDLGIVYKEEARKTDEMVNVLSKLSMAQLKEIKSQRTPEDYFRLFAYEQGRQIEDAEIIDSPGCVRDGVVAESEDVARTMPKTGCSKNHAKNRRGGGLNLGETETKSGVPFRRGVRIIWISLWILNRINSKCQGKT